VVTQTKLKGLDQAAKDYGNTTKEQQVNPQFSAIARKNQILASTLNEHKLRLSVVEAKLVVDRAVKVGASAEAQRLEQETVLAELYRSSPAEFKAYARLIADLETNSGKKDIAMRTVDKVKAAMEKRGSLVVEGSEGSSHSLDTGNFFDD
jgi:predicted DNA-binding transcriptional regulator YafY